MRLNGSDVPPIHQVAVLLYAGLQTLNKQEAAETLPNPLVAVRLTCWLPFDC